MNKYDFTVVNMQTNKVVCHVTAKSVTEVWQWMRTSKDAKEHNWLFWGIHEL